MDGNGLRTSNVPESETLDQFLGNGPDGTAVATFEDVATQLVTDGPVADAIAGASSEAGDVATSVQELGGQVAALELGIPDPSLTPSAALALIKANSQSILAVIDAASSPAIEFTDLDPAKYSGYLIRFADLKPATPGDILRLRMSTDGGASWDAGAAAYSRQSNVMSGTNTLTVDGSDGDSFIALTMGAIGNSVDKSGVVGTVTVLRPELVSPTAVFSEAYAQITDGRARRTAGGGMRLADEAVNGLQIFFSAGDILSGTVIIEGIPAQVIDDVSDTTPGIFDIVMAAKADLASPLFTGIPRADTAVPGTNTNQLSTTAFVLAEIATLLDDAPEDLNSFGKLAAMFGNDPEYAASITAALAAKSGVNHDHTAAEINDTEDKVMMLASERGKLEGIAAGANVTNAANVAASISENEEIDGEDLTGADILGVRAAARANTLVPLTVAALAAFSATLFDHTSNPALLAALDQKAYLLDGKIPVELLPASVGGGMQYIGVWDAGTNTPAIPPASAENNGHHYRVGLAGSTAIDGIATWAKGDLIVSNGTTWEKIEEGSSEFTAAAPYLDNLQFTLNQTFEGHGATRQFIRIGYDGSDSTVEFGRINLHRDGGTDRIGTDGVWTRFVMPSNNTTAFYYGDLTTGDILETADHAVAQDSATVAFLGCARRGNFSNATGMTIAEPWALNGVRASLDTVKPDILNAGDWLQIGPHIYEIAPADAVDAHLENSAGVKVYEAGLTFSTFARLKHALETVGRTPNYRPGDILEADGVPYRYVADDYEDGPVKGLEPRDNVSPLHWGMPMDGFMSGGDGSVTGTNASPFIQAALDYYRVKVEDGDQSNFPEFQFTLGRFGKLRISNSIDMTGFGKEEPNRRFMLTGVGCTLLGDCGGEIMLDATGSLYMDLADLAIFGSKKEGLTPLCALKTGRIANNNAGGRMSIMRVITHDTLLSSTFLQAAYWNMSSEDMAIRDNEFTNNGPTGYGFAYDSGNRLAYPHGVQLLQSISNDSTAIFETVEPHGLVGGETVVGTNRAIANDLNPKDYTQNDAGETFEGWAWTVVFIDASRFTLTSDDGDFDGTGYVMPTGMAIAKEEFAPSKFIGRSRAEPLKEASHIANVIERNKFTCRFGWAAVMAFQNEGMRLVGNFIKGRIGIHLFISMVKDRSGLGFASCHSDIHVEGDEEIDAQFFIDKAASDAPSTLRCGDCTFLEPGKGAAYMFELGEGVDVIELQACQLRYTRARASHVGLVKGGELHIIGGEHVIPEAIFVDDALVKFRNADVHYTKTGTYMNTRRAFLIIDKDSGEDVELGRSTTIIKDVTTLTGNVNRNLQSDMVNDGDLVQIHHTGSGGNLNCRDDDTGDLIYAVAPGQSIDIIRHEGVWQACAA